MSERKCKTCEYCKFDSELESYVCGNKDSCKYDNVVSENDTCKNHKMFDLYMEF